MRFAKDNALMLEATKPKKVKLPGGGWYKIDRLGDKRWFNSENKLHRLDGPAVEWADGSKLWYINGKLHRLDGPAFEYANGTKEWWVNGKRHRLDGPAFEYADGRKSWWVNNNCYFKYEFDKLFGKYKDLEDRRVIADMEGMF